MIWERYKRLSWVSHDLPGFMLDIVVTHPKIVYTKINVSTGEIVKTKTFSCVADDKFVHGCALDAINEGKAELEAYYVQNEKERKEQKRNINCRSADHATRR